MQCEPQLYFISILFIFTKFLKNKKLCLSKNTYKYAIYPLTIYRYGFIMNTIGEILTKVYLEFQH